MNILIFSWRGPGHPNAGGAEIATYEHAKAWINAGHNVTLFTSGFEKGKKYEEDNGIKIVRRGNQFLGVHILGFLWYLIGKHPKFDIVVDQFHGIPFFTPFFVKTKILAYIHEAATEVWKKNELREPYGLLASLIGPVVEPFIFRFYKNTDFITVSESTKNDLMRFGIKRQKITVIHNGINKVSVKNTKKEKTITFLGALSQDKGVIDAIKILGELLRKDEGWKLNIVGRGGNDYLRLLKSKTKELGVEDKVVFTGYVSERKKYNILSRSFCLVNPSIHEGWGLVNIEANSMSTPVFAYKVKGISDSVVDGKTGILVEKGDVNRLAMEIIKLYNDKKRYENFSKASLKWSNRFSWEKAGSESTLLIESL